VAEAEFDRLFAVNPSRSTLRRHIVPAMKSGRKAGAILTHSPHRRRQPPPNLAWYTLQGWMITATRACDPSSPVGASRQRDQRGRRHAAAGHLHGEDTPEARARILTTIRCAGLDARRYRRHGVFLCSDEAAMITGVAWRSMAAGAYDD